MLEKADVETWVLEAAEVETGVDEVAEVDTTEAVDEGGGELVLEGGGGFEVEGCAVGELDCVGPVGGT